VKDVRREGPQSLVVAWTLDGVPIGKMDVAILVIKIDFAFGIPQWSYSKEGGMKFLEVVGCASFRREEAWKWEGCCVGRLDVLFVHHLHMDGDCRWLGVQLWVRCEIVAGAAGVN
jgi:hypothetical protein